MKPLDPAIDIINIANMWFALDNELLVARHNGVEDYSVSAMDLDRYHPKLNVVIRELLHQKAQRNKSARVGGVEVRSALDILTTGGFTFNGIRGDTNTLASISNLTVNEFRGQAVLHGASVVMTTLFIDGEEIPVGSEATWSTHVLTMGELDKCSPGWQQRFENGQALGLEDQALLQYTFPPNRPDQVVPNMTSITFE